MTDQTESDHCKHGTPRDPNWICVQCCNEALRQSADADYDVIGATVTQTESASEYAELLADLDFYDEDHWRNVMRQYPGAQDTIRKAAAAIRALEAKVQGMEAAIDWLERDRALIDQRATIQADRADKYASMCAYLMPALAEAHEHIAADRDRISANYDVLLIEHIKVTDERNEAWQERDRLSGEVERLTGLYNQRMVHLNAAQGREVALLDEVERIRVQFDEAIARIEDMLKEDDGQAFKEAGKFLLRIKGSDHES